MTERASDDAPRTAGYYLVRCGDGPWKLAYYLKRKDIWVTTDGGKAVEGVTAWRETRGKSK